jgi:hypothetical protein
VIACRALRDALGLRVVVEPVSGLDQVLAELARGELVVHLGWDIWSGMFVFAREPAGDRLVREIAAWLEARLGEPAFAEHVGS